MRKAALSKMSSPELVEQFRLLALAQYDAELYNDYRKYNRLYDRLVRVSDELKSREGDQRRLLLMLFDDPNVNVRLCAAKEVLAISCAAAREQLEAIKASKIGPYGLSAGMCLWNLDRGVFKPT